MNFDSLTSGSPLSAGTVITDQFAASLGMTISTPTNNFKDSGLDIEGGRTKELRKIFFPCLPPLDFLNEALRATSWHLRHNCNRKENSR